MDKPPEKIILVDDDRNLLDAFRRQFRKTLHFETATSGADGVQAVRDGGPFAVVISDMMKPNMNGVEFLSRIRQLSPSTVRIMLTGNANLEVAIDAVNDGNVYRFLNKPVESDQLHSVNLSSNMGRRHKQPLSHQSEEHHHHSLQVQSHVNQNLFLGLQL